MATEGSLQQRQLLRQGLTRHRVVGKKHHDATVIARQEWAKASPAQSRMNGLLERARRCGAGKRIRLRSMLKRQRDNDVRRLEVVPEWTCASNQPRELAPMAIEEDVHDVALHSPLHILRRPGP
jgi:hypothetical protein